MVSIEDNKLLNKVDLVIERIQWSIEPRLQDPR